MGSPQIRGGGGAYRTSDMISQIGGCGGVGGVVGAGYSIAILHTVSGAMWWDLRVQSTWALTLKNISAISDI